MATTLAVGVFPSSDHFPLGRVYGAVDRVPEPPSVARPFGLTLAASPRMVVIVDTAAISYDEDRQIGLMRDGDELVPLPKHTDGPTNTVTDGGDGGDGQSTNRDSDSDHRED